MFGLARKYHEVSVYFSKIALRQPKSHFLNVQFKPFFQFQDSSRKYVTKLLNINTIKTFFKNQGKLLIFTQPVKDFYIEDQLTSDSITIAECALFLQQDTNKTNFVIEN